MRFGLPTNRSEREGFMPREADGHQATVRAFARKNGFLLASKETEESLGYSWWVCQPRTAHVGTPAISSREIVKSSVPSYLPGS